MVTTTSALAQEFTCHQPSKQILEVLEAPMTPAISVSPSRDYAVLMRPLRYRPISEVAQPMLRLAGIRIDSNTNGMHLAPAFTAMWIKRLSDGADITIAMAGNAKPGNPIWSPDGKQFAFNAYFRQRDRVVDRNRRDRQGIPGAVINGVRLGGGRGGPGQGNGAIEWMGDNRTLIVHLAPANRGAVPAANAIPPGPHVQQSLGIATFSAKSPLAPGN